MTETSTDLQTRTGPVDTDMSTPVPVVEDCTSRTLEPGAIVATLNGGVS